MAKRRQRITPKIPKRPRKDYYFSSFSTSASSDSVDENKAESSSSSRVDKKSEYRSSGSSTERTTGKTRKKDTKDKTGGEKRRNSFQRIRDITVSKSAFSKWKPLRKSTKEYSKQVIANTQLNIVGEVNDAHKDQVNHCLQNLQKRIIEKVDTLRGPDCQTDYKLLEQESKNVEETLSAVNSQLQTLENELDTQKKLLEEEEEMLEKQENINPSDDTQNVQGETSSSMHQLIKLSKESLERPIPQINVHLLKTWIDCENQPRKIYTHSNLRSWIDLSLLSDDNINCNRDLNKTAQKLANVLSKRKEEFEQKGLFKWMEALTQLQSQINNNNINE